MVKKCNGWSRISALDKVVLGKGRYGRNDEQTFQNIVSSWSSVEAKFLVWGFEVAQETWPPKDSQQKMFPYFFEWGTSSL